MSGAVDLACWQAPHLMESTMLGLKLNLVKCILCALCHVQDLKAV